MSYTATLEGDITGPLTTTTVAKIQGNTVTAPAPVAGQALVYNGVAWVPQASTPTSALSASLIFRAAGPTAGNVFATWALLYAAFLTTDGPVTIVIDTAPGGVVTATNVPAGAYNMQGRATIAGFSDRATAGGPPYINLLTCANGAVFTDLPEITGPLQVTVAPAALANIPFVFTAAQSRLVLSNGATLSTTAAATFPVINAPTGTFNFIMDRQCTLDTSQSTTANGVFVTLTATSTFTTSTYDQNNVSNQPVVGYAIGPAGSLLKFFLDASGVGDFGPPPLTGFPAPGSGYAGTPANLNLADFSQGVQYNPVFLTAPRPPPLSIGGVFVVQAQAAIDSLNTRENQHFSQQFTNTAAAYTLDSGATQDQTIFSNLSLAQYNLPLVANFPGRELTIKDILGVATGGIVFQLNPNGADKIETGLIGASLQYPTPYGSITLKSDGLNTWWRI